jgi:hypothetical protein
MIKKCINHKFGYKETIKIIIRKMAHHNHFDVVAHEYYGRGGGFDLWHIVGIVLGIIVLLALIGICLNCIRSNTVYTGQPVVY